MISTEQRATLGSRILWLKTGPLHPVDTGGKIRTYHVLKELKRNHHVTFLALLPRGTPASVREAASEYSHEQVWIPWDEPPKRGLRLVVQILRNFCFSRLPFVIGKYQSALMRSAIDGLVESGKIDLILCDFLTPSINLPAPPDLRKRRTILFQHNVESMIWKRTWEQARGSLRRAYFFRQWKRMVAYETRACASFDGVLAVSEQDARVFRTELGLGNVVGAVPTGVDTNYFATADDAARWPLSMVFLGSMDWMPNIDGAVFFMEKVFPAIRARFPGTTLTIVGRNPGPPILELAAKHPEVTVTGTVPDVRPHLAGGQVMIVPLRVGGGTRIKIFEAMATGIPVVSTTIGAEGLPVEHGTHALLADTPADFAAAVGRVFEDAVLRRSLAEAARNLVARHYGWPAVTAVFEELLERSPAPGAPACASI